MRTRDIKELLQEKNTDRMPAIFVGHGSPMNAIEQNEFSEMWQQIGNLLEKPKAILCISAHWETKGTYVTAMEKPKTIHDFGGFPRDLYQIQYPVDGSPSLAAQITSMSLENIHLDNEWGLDHGTWSILVHMFPKADIPVVQLSVDYTKLADEHFQLSQELKSLRDNGFLIIGSGNIVHNLRQMYVEDGDFNKELAHQWATQFNDTVRENIINSNFEKLVDYTHLTEHWNLSVPTPDHYYPLLYILGVQNEDDELSFFNDKIIAGAISMTSFMYK